MNAKETETVNEKIYQIIMITEADYGCEECPPEGPAALVCGRNRRGIACDRRVGRKTANCGVRTENSDPIEEIRQKEKTWRKISLRRFQE